MNAKLNGSEIQVGILKVKSKPKSYGTISYQKIEITERI
jgi:hypothetical protein